MAPTLEGGLPPDLPLNNGCQIVLHGLDPTTGNAVSGILLDNVAIYGINIGPSTEPDQLAPFMWVPGPPEAV